MEPIEFTGDPEIDEVLKLLELARQYEEDWLEYGTNRVYKYFDDVDGDWLENWGENDDV